MKLVIPNTKEGRTVNPVISNKICKGNEYSVVFPFEETFNAGNPENPDSAKAWNEKPLTINIAVEKDMIFVKFLKKSKIKLLSLIKYTLLLG